MHAPAIPTAQLPPKNCLPAAPRSLEVSPRYLICALGSGRYRATVLLPPSSQLPPVLGPPTLGAAPLHIRTPLPPPRPAQPHAPVKRMTNAWHTARTLAWSPVGQLSVRANVCVRACRWAAGRVCRRKHVHVHGSCHGRVHGPASRHFLCQGCSER
eukprot:152348-Chlamydomonas_euryale.AAC.1